MSQIFPRVKSAALAGKKSAPGDWVWTSPLLWACNDLFWPSIWVQCLNLDCSGVFCVGLLRYSSAPQDWPRRADFWDWVCSGTGQGSSIYAWSRQRPWSPHFVLHANAEPRWLRKIQDKAGWALLTVLPMRIQCHARSKQCFFKTISDEMLENRIILHEQALDHAQFQSFAAY